MERKFSNLFGLFGEKAIAPTTSTVTAFEATREGQPKAYIPNFFYKPPFGYPRYKDLNYYRQLAASIYVDMCETAIIDEVCSVEWDIVAEDRAGNEIPGKEKDVERITQFFENPNTNKESWETIVRMMLPDLLELNSGIMVKTFNAFGKFVEIVARDGAAFTKNPDPYGMYTNRADLILIKDIMNTQEESAARENLSYPLLGGITGDQAREDGAYFQYGMNTAARPVPFGKREIVWFEKKVRTDDLYGRSAMEVLSKTVQTLIYAVEHNLEYFSDNSIPPGVLGLDGMSTADMKAFAMQWTESQKKQDSLGAWKKAFHKLAMVNKIPKFERLGYTNQELELIESQKWWSKMVWAAFGITATELGFTEDAKGSANQIVQTSIAKKRIIYPLLRLIEYHVNTEIMPEFGVEGIRYKYKIFDIDEETKKWGLYKLQTDSDLKTINEVRNAEGLEALEGGDETGSMRADRQQTEDREMFVASSPQQEADEINRDSQNTRDQMTAQKKSYLKYKYAKRTGSPGNYIYWYKNPKTGKLTAGDKLEKPKRSKEYNDAVEDAKEQIFRYNSTANEAVVAMEENNPSLTKEELMEIALDVENYEKENFEKMTPLEMFNSYKPESKAQTTESGLTLQPNEEKAFLKFKYAKRTGSPGNYIYWYKLPNGKYTQGEKPKEVSKKDPPGDKEHFYHLTTPEAMSGIKKSGLKQSEEGYAGKAVYFGEQPKDTLGYYVESYDSGVMLRVNREALYDKFGKYSKDNPKGDVQYDPTDDTGEVTVEKDIPKEMVEYWTGQEWKPVADYVETKAMADSPLTLQPNEEMGPKQLESGIKRVLDKNRKKMLEILDSQFKEDPLIRIKSIDDLPKMIKQFFAAFALKELSDQVIKSEFDSGWENTEKQIQQNIPYNPGALEFLQQHVFDNIKGMTEEISNDLKQELERGIINGEGITKLKARVNSVFDVGDNRAQMIARTETNRAENNGKLLAVKGSNMDQDYNKKWVTHEDDRTSAICHGLDGQTVGINEDFHHGKWTGQSPPSHVNCRSSIVFVEKE